MADIAVKNEEQVDNNEKIEKIPLTCIICPIGCLMEVTIQHKVDKKSVIDVKDNTCPRGEEYAKKELINPTRTLTTTIAVIAGESSLVPVKTDGEVPKESLMNCMEIIRRQSIHAPIKRGSVLIRDILGTGVNVIACSDVSK